MILNTRAVDLAIKIQKLTGVNVLNKSRKRSVVETRAMFNKILYDFSNMTLAQIRDFYISKGKPMNHATVLHSLRNFNMYRIYNPKLNKSFEQIIKQYELSTKYEKQKSIEQKIKYLSDKNLDKAHALVNKLFTKELIGLLDNGNK